VTESKVYQLTLGAIRVVRAVLKHKNLTVAAREVGISQPAVSQHLARFEQILGQPIIVRRGNDLIVRDQKAMAALHTLGEGLDQLLNLATDCANGDVKPRLGVSMMVFDRLVTVPRVLTNLMSRFEISTGTSNELEAQFAAAQLDMSFRVLGLQDAETDLRQTYPLYWVKACGSQSKARLDELPVILGSAQALYASRTEAHLRALGVNYKVVVRVPQAATILKLVASDWGVAAVPPFILNSRINYCPVEIDPELPVVENLCHGVTFHKKVVSYTTALDAFEEIRGVLDTSPSDHVTG
jgi:DNA-binding transcriptional LysR family regulator